MGMAAQHHIVVDWIRDHVLGGAFAVEQMRAASPLIAVRQVVVSELEVRTSEVTAAADVVIESR
jgi:hypothetical protein